MLATASRRNSFTCADGDDAVLELWNTIFTGATPVVFAIAAAAALVQLRHLHASYQITAASTLLQTYWSPQFQDWLHFVIFDLDEGLGLAQNCGWQLPQTAAALHASSGEELQLVRRFHSFQRLGDYACLRMVYRSARPRIA